MSGPKHCSYSVRANEMRRQREREVALTEIRRLTSAVQASLDHLLALAPDATALLSYDLQAIEREIDVADHEQVLALPGRLRTVYDRARTELSRSEARRERDAGMSARLAAAGAELDRFEVQQLDRRRAEAEGWRGPLLAKLDELRGLASVNELERIDLIAALAMDDRHARASLKSDAMALQSIIAARVKGVDEAAAMRLRCSGFASPEAAGLVKELEAVEAGHREFDSELRRRANRLVDRLTADEDRQYVARVLADGFRELGYTVEPGFVTAFQRGEDLRLRRAGDHPYVAQLKLDLDKLEFDAELVVVDERVNVTAEEISRRDNAAEQAWCADLAKVTTAARALGVVGTARAKRRIGEQPVRSVVASRGSADQPIAKTVPARHSARALKP